MGPHQNVFVLCTTMEFSLANKTCQTKNHILWLPGGFHCQTPHQADTDNSTRNSYFICQSCELYIAAAWPGTKPPQSVDSVSLDVFHNLPSTATCFHPQSTLELVWLSISRAFFFVVRVIGLDPPGCDMVDKIRVLV